MVWTCLHFYRENTLFNHFFPRVELVGGEFVAYEAEQRIRCSLKLNEFTDSTLKTYTKAVEREMEVSLLKYVL